MTMFIPESSINAVSIDFYAGEGTPNLSQAVFELERTGLLGKEFVIGPVDTIRNMYPDAKTGGVILSPTFSGIEIFLYANGKGDIPAGMFLLPQLKVECLFAATFPPTGEKVPRYFNLGVTRKPE